MHGQRGDQTMLDLAQHLPSRTPQGGNAGDAHWLKDEAKKHLLSPKVHNGERCTGQAVGTPCPLSCLLLTEEVLFSGGTELPLLLYEVVGALALEVPSPPLSLLGRDPEPGISLGCEITQKATDWKGIRLVAVSRVFTSQTSKAAWFPSSHRVQ